jgi:hypothetical protein
MSEESRYVVTVQYDVNAFDADTAARLISQETGAPLAEGYARYGTDAHLPSASVVQVRTIWIESGLPQGADR